jgi:NifB/MoaA-like Fe-S oxidoreductase
MAPFLSEEAPRLAQATGASVEILDIENRFYGKGVSVAGLLGGADIVAGVGATRQDEVILLAAEALNSDDVFIDDVPISEVRAALEPATVVAGYTIFECLESL